MNRIKLLLAAILLVAGCVGADEKNTMKESGANKKVNEADLKSKLSPLQYHVTQEEGTERAFHNEYWDNHREGIYVDVVTNEPLFSSKDKFDSGSGWPSFTKPLDKEGVTYKSDNKLAQTRVEVRSKEGDSHLGHVFNDGPGPTGKRYCINSAALRFIPAEDLKSAGFEELAQTFQKSSAVNEKSAATSTTQKALLAGGCFWGMEDLIRKQKGVLETRVGYTGGSLASPVYEIVKTGTTGHAEAIEVTYDATKTSYEEILQYFFRIHDPTTLNRQGNDLGTQYRSAIFYMNDEQRKIAEKVKESVNQSGKWNRPVVTQIVAAKEFFPAEEYHQDYLEKNPGGYTCHFERD